MSEQTNALWRDFETRHWVRGDPPAHEPPTPWFVRILLGVAGWLASLFLLGFMGLGLEDLLDEPAGAIITGLILCAATAALMRLRRQHVFLGQMTYAFSLAGQACVILGAAQIDRFDTQHMATAATLLGVGLFAAAPAYPHRIWCAAMATFASMYLAPSPLLGLLLPPLMSGLLVWLWLSSLENAAHTALKQAAGYGMLAALLLVWCVPELRDWHWKAVTGAPAYLPVLAYLAPALYSLLFVLGAARLLRDTGVSAASRAGRGMMVLALAIAAACYLAPPLSPLLLVVLIGFAQANRVLTGLGILLLLVFMSRYYYDLQLTLLWKSVVLMVSGVVLLAARQALKHWAWEVEHA